MKALKILGAYIFLNDECTLSHWEVSDTNGIITKEAGEVIVVYEDIYIKAIWNHLWLPSTYNWSEDNLSCTAQRICMRDHSHIESETVDTQYAIVTPATAGANGSGTYITVSIVLLIQSIKAKKANN